ncbi:Transient receptor putative cation channel sub V member 4 [Blyttiomyces sp. JEL0837]|nr:Transient receptor putative cation channel sub V member 4 [Blyttiomyces sp. JEL0837]
MPAPISAHKDTLQNDHKPKNTVEFVELCEIDDPQLVPQVAQLLSGDSPRHDHVHTDHETCTDQEPVAKDGRHKFWRLMRKCWRQVVKYWRRLVKCWKRMVEYLKEKVESFKKRAGDLEKVLIQKVEPLKEYTFISVMLLWIWSITSFISKWFLLIWYVLISGGVKTRKVNVVKLWVNDVEGAKLKESKHSVWSVMAGDYRGSTQPHADDHSDPQDKKRIHGNAEDLKKFIEDEKVCRWRRQFLKTHRLEIKKHAKVKGDVYTISISSDDAPKIKTDSPTKKRRFLSLPFFGKSSDDEDGSKKNNGETKTRNLTFPFLRKRSSTSSGTTPKSTPPTSSLATPLTGSPPSSQPSDIYEWQKEISRDGKSIEKVLLLLHPPPEDLLDARGKMIREGIEDELDRWFKMDEVVNNKLLELYAKQIISERGPDGETILHYALLNRRASMLQYFLGYGQYKDEAKRFPYLNLLINKVYEGATYWGQHVCHIAVVSYGDNITMLKRLVERGADVHRARARGIFFQRGDDNFYMGETVLAFAAVMGHQRIVDYLIRDLHYDPNVTDSWGNNVLHVLAWHGYYSNHREWHSNRDRKKKSISPRIESLMGGIYDQLVSGGDSGKADNPKMPADADGLTDETREKLKIVDKLASGAGSIFSKSKIPANSLSSHAKEKFLKESVGKWHSHSGKRKSKAPPVKILMGKIYDQLASGGDAILDKPRMPDYGLSEEERREFVNEFMDEKVKGYFEVGLDSPQVEQHVKTQVEQQAEPQVEQHPEPQVDQQVLESQFELPAESQVELAGQPEVEQLVLEFQVKQPTESQVEIPAEPQVIQHVEPQVEQHAESQVEQHVKPQTEKVETVAGHQSQSRPVQLRTQLDLLSEAVLLVLQQLENHVETVVDHLSESHRSQEAKRSREKGKLTIGEKPQYTDSTKELNLTLEQSKLVRELRSADDTLANDDKLTPLIVAAANGKAGMVQALLDYKMELMWDYGTVKKTRLDLSELDTFREEATMNHEMGALETAVRNNDSEIIRLPVFQRLLECKWRLYGERIALWRFFNQLTYLIVFTIALSLLPNDETYYGTDTQNRSRFDYVKYFGRECGEIWAAGIRKYVTGFGWFENMLQWVDFILFSMGVGFRLSYLNFPETVTWGLYAIVAIITIDVVNFGIILSVFLLGFGSALWLEMAPFADFVYNSQYDGVDITQAPNVGYTEWRRLIPGALVWWIRLFLGQGANFDDYRNSGSAFTLILFLAFVLFVNILLVNVFVAMINQTFSKIIGESERQWRLMWANTIIKMDEKINSRDAKSRKKDSKRRFPITRIGIPNVATTFKPSDWLAENKEDAVTRQAKKVFRRFGWWKTKVEESNGEWREDTPMVVIANRQLVAEMEDPVALQLVKKLFRWLGYQSQNSERRKTKEFLLEYHAGSDLPLYVTASLDYDSPLSVANCFESFQNSTGWSTAVGGWANQGLSSRPRKIKTRLAKDLALGL